MRSIKHIFGGFISKSRCHCLSCYDLTMSTMVKIIVRFLSSSAAVSRRCYASIISIFKLKSLLSFLLEAILGDYLNFFLHSRLLIFYLFSLKTCCVIVLRCCAKEAGALCFHTLLLFSSIPRSNSFHRCKIKTNICFLDMNKF